MESIELESVESATTVVGAAGVATALAVRQYDKLPLIEKARPTAAQQFCALFDPLPVVKFLLLI